MSNSRKTKPAQGDWIDLSMRSWQLGMDMVMVMSLRSARILAGGAIGRREANRMVSEKLLAAAQFGAAWSRLGPGPTGATGHMLDFYGPRVRRNRRRLTRR